MSRPEDASELQPSGRLGLGAVLQGTNEEEGVALYNLFAVDPPRRLQKWAEQLLGTTGQRLERLNSER